MNEELKCPMGCDEILNAESDQYYACENCWFRCDKADLPRITAAMELAKAEVAASNATMNVPLERLDAAMEAAEAMLFQAKMRILEVFVGG